MIVYSFMYLPLFYYRYGLATAIRTAISYEYGSIPIAVLKQIKHLYIVGFTNRTIHKSLIRFKTLLASLQWRAGLLKFEAATQPRYLARK